MKKILMNPIKTILLLIIISMFVGDVLFTKFINPASIWLFNFNIPILNIPFGIFSMFLVLLINLLLGIFGNRVES